MVARLALPIEVSSQITGRNLKIGWFGATATRKTETGLRLFPDVFLVDTEGNSDQVIGMPEIPEFLRLKTKDVYKVMEALDAVIAGDIKFPDGRPIQTVIVDSGTVLWSVRQEVGSLMAEERARKYARGADVNPDAVNMAQLDWVKAKRPLKQLMTRFANSPIQYLVFTAREKDLYEDQEQPGGGEKKLVKVGVGMDIQKGVDYEMNLGFQFRFNKQKQWECEVTKAQGGLGVLMPVGTVLKEFPIAVIKKYVALSPVQGAGVEDELDSAKNQLAHEQHSKEQLVAYGRSKGLEPADVAAALKANELTFDVGKWDLMIAAVDARAVESI